MTSPVYDHALVMKARDFAVQGHAGQLHGSTTLMGHLDETVRLLMKMKVESTTLAAGYLHLTFATGNSSAQELRMLFGSDILAIVQSCTVSSSGSRGGAETLASQLAVNAESARVILAAGLSLMSRSAGVQDSALRANFARDLPYIWVVLHGAAPVFAERLQDIAEVPLSSGSGRYALTS